MPRHDQLFKLLLKEFFRDFLAAFAPELVRDLALGGIQFVDKELIRARGRAGKTKLVDLVARVKFQDEEGFVLVHVEHQARRDKETGRRLFLYAAWLNEAYGLPVFPILVTSYDAPGTPEPDRFVMEARGFRVLEFRYRVVQLNRLNWRDYARQRNPATTALMAKMRIGPADRLKARLQILRLLATLRLTPAKMDLIAGFVEEYLALTAKEMMALAQEVDRIEAVEERESVMKLMTCWERKGREEGLVEGRLELVKRQLVRRFGPLKPALERKIGRLDEQRLIQLAEALLYFTAAKDVDRWLASQAR